MKFKFSLALLILPLLTFSQKLQRNVFQYEKLKSDHFTQCDEIVTKELEKAILSIQENNSPNAVAISKKIYENKKDCFLAFDTYGYSLFRSGEWFEGIEIIEKGIEKFGSVPELIKRKSEMSLEMAELGTGQKNIDGNSVFKANSISYEEEQFKNENLQSALIDLEYLRSKFNRNEETFYVAKIQQLLKIYDKSNETFKTLLNDEEYKNIALFNIADNYIALKDYDTAETELNKLLNKNPKEAILYEKLAEIYDLKKDKTKENEFSSKSIFYKNMPSFSSLEYSKENFDLLKFFGTEENKPNKKLKKLNEINSKNNQEYTIDVCLMILKLHANHGNGIEEKAAEILTNIGKPAIEKVNQLFKSDVSTCTITNLADIMANIKDENSWILMKEYLPYIAIMPMTLIPPSLPEKMIQFNESKGIEEVLAAIKPLLNQEQDSTNPLAEMGGFGNYVYYEPLKKINKEKLKKIASQLHYSDKEFAQLEEKIK